MCVGHPGAGLLRARNCRGLAQSGYNHGLFYGGASRSARSCGMSGGGCWRWCLIALAGCTLAQQSVPPWPERLYNPQPADGDLVLPMPCGGAMAFRRIDVPDRGALNDQEDHARRPRRAVRPTPKTAAPTISSAASPTKRDRELHYYPRRVRGHVSACDCDERRLSAAQRGGADAEGLRDLGGGGGVRCEVRRVARQGGC